MPALKQPEAEPETAQVAPERAAPQVFYGPGDTSRVFQPEEDVPEGWEDHPRKVADFVDPLSELKPLDL